MIRLGWLPPVLWAVVVMGVCPATAQPVEVVGARALGMGGAFVAVADDASAVHWNPSGLAGGDFFGAAVDLNWQESPREGTAAAVGTNTLPANGFTLVMPPLGLGYYHATEAGVSRVDASGTVPAGDVPIVRLSTHQFGVTLLQTLGGGLTVGGTLKFVRGSFGSGTAPATDPPDVVRETARDLDGPSSNAFDIDVGAHFRHGPFSAGVLARNLTRPGFASSEGPAVHLDRQVRAGVAVRPGEPWIVSVDADLLIAESATDRWRRAAAGVERWWGRKVALRGGARINTVGATRPVGSAGASLAIRSGVWLEGYGTAGASDAEQAWGVSLRFAY